MPASIDDGGRVERDRMVLRPDPGAAFRWSMAAVALMAAAAWLVRDDGGVVAWVGFAVALAVAAYFVLQLIAPGLFEIVLDDGGIHGRNLLHDIDAPWPAIHVARVTHVAGDPVLQVGVRTPSETRAVALLLPVGADLDALHAVLATRLGRPTA